MSTPQKSTSDCGQQATLSSIAREEVCIAFQQKLITHNQFAINVAKLAPAYFHFSAIDGEDVENCADLLCKNECANRKRIERYINGSEFDKNLVPALIQALPKERRAIAKQRIMSLFGYVDAEEQANFVQLQMASIKESSEANVAISSSADLATQAKEIEEARDAYDKALKAVQARMARGEK